MTEQLISTSSPKCLDGNAGFGIVAQSEGMAPNVARDIGILSGYSHLFPAGDSRNPTAFLHVVRRSGGTDRHVISRVADCGNDYSGRTNRIGHHWIVEEYDLRSYKGSCPATIALLPDIFNVSWNKESGKLDRNIPLPNPPAVPRICTHWKTICGDAGWGGVVAEHIEKGNPVSIVFEPGTNVLPLLAEAFALLPPEVRWKTTFSTFFMKSQEPPGTPLIQVKCFAAGTPEAAFARRQPNVLCIDLRDPPAGAPPGEYVELARSGPTAKPVVSTPVTVAPSVPTVTVPGLAVDVPTYDYELGVTPVPGASHPPPTPSRPRKASKTRLLSIIAILVVALAVGGIVSLSMISRPETETASQKKDDDEQKTSDENEKAKAKQSAREAEKREREENKEAIQTARNAVENGMREVEEAFSEVKTAQGSVTTTNAKTKAAQAKVEDINEKIEQAEVAVEEKDLKTAAEHIGQVELAIADAEQLAQNAKNVADNAVEQAGNAKSQAGNAAKIVAEKVLPASEAVKVAEGVKAPPDNTKEDAKEEKPDAEQAIMAAKEAIEAIRKSRTDAQVAIAVKTAAEAVKNAAEAVKDASDAVNTAANTAKNEIDSVVVGIETAKTRGEEVAGSIRQNSVQDCLAALSDKWESDKGDNIANIALPFTERSLKGTLVGSKIFLEKLGDISKVTISIEPFVNLKVVPRLDEEEGTQANRFEIRRNDEPEQHKINFLYDTFTLESGEKLSDEEIITFSLDEDGISYEWNTELITRLNDQEHHRIFNRILLSRLRIETEGFDEKVIPLWTPVEYKLREFERAFGSEVTQRGSFTLWKPGQKEFIIDPSSDKAFLLIDFNEVIYEDAPKSINEPKTFERFVPSWEEQQWEVTSLSFAYAPKLPPLGAVAEESEGKSRNKFERHCVVRPDTSPEAKGKQKISILFVTENEMKYLDADDSLKKAENDQKAYQKAFKDIGGQSEITSLTRQNSALERELKDGDAGKAEKEKQKEENNKKIEEIKNIQNNKNNSDGKVIFYKRLTSQYADAKPPKERLGRNAHIDQFSIYLLKPESDSNDLSNCLLLFRVAE